MNIYFLAIVRLHLSKDRRPSGVGAYIKNLELMEVLWCTLCITSAKRSAQLNTFIFLLSLCKGMESVTISSDNLDFSIFS